MQIRDRVRELRRVQASELRPSPRNWRTHPRAQQEALQGVLAEVGYADALLARELPDGSLELIDGHLRAQTTPDTLVPVLVLDVTESEATKLLASLDPLAGMAEPDPVKLDALLREVDTGSPALQEMLADLAEKSGAIPARSPADPANDPDAEWRGMPEFEHEDQTADAAFIIRVFLKDEEDLAAFGRLLGKDLTGRKFVWFGKQPLGETYEAVDG
jgi:hypothetical protein